MARGLPMDRKDAAQARLVRMIASVLAFASGCTAAALLYSSVGVLCFLVPPVLGAGLLTLNMTAHESDGERARS
jgi:uncharacterized membrane protein YoaK (UPF0700 family)